MAEQEKIEKKPLKESESLKEKIEERTYAIFVTCRRTPGGKEGKPVLDIVGIKPAQSKKEASSEYLETKSAEEQGKAATANPPESSIQNQEECELCSILEDILREKEETETSESLELQQSEMNESREQ